MAKKNQNKGQQPLSEAQYLRQRARTLAIGKCYISEDVEHSGSNMIIVTRCHTGGKISVGCYIVDKYCLGVKDSFYRLRMEEYELDELLETGYDDLTFRECSYEEAHNRIYGAIAFADEAGISPDKSFALSQYMLEDDTDDVPLIEYDFGKDGEHYLICHSMLEASRYLPLMDKNLGKGNYKYIIRTDDDLYEDEPSHVTMAEILKDYGKDEIIYNAAVLGIELDESLTEEEVREKYIDAVKTDPKLALISLPSTELFLLKTMIDKPGENHELEAPNSIEEPMLVRFGFAEGIYYEDTEQHVFNVADDFFEDIVRPHLDEVLSNEFKAFMEITEVCVSGLANLYGEAGVDQVKQLLARQLKQDEDLGRALTTVFHVSLRMHDMIMPIVPDFNLDNLVDGEVVFMSRYLNFSRFNMHKALAKSDCEVDVPRQFDDEDIVLAGLSLPIIPNQMQGKFGDLLYRRFGFTNNEISEHSVNLWIRAQHERHLDDTELESAEEYFVGKVIEKAKKKVSKTMRDKAMSLFGDYMDCMPRWSLKGYSPREVREM